ncbi:hypothetical protein [Methylobacterium brachiatum]|jgi:hypothetical protein
MRARLQGGEFVVEVDREEVEEFASHWPCSNLTTSAAKEFSFSAGNGDLIDACTLSDGQRLSTLEDDGPALAALAEEALLFGARALDLRSVLEIRFPQETAAAPRP